MQGYAKSMIKKKIYLKLEFVNIIIIGAYELPSKMYAI